MRQAARAGPPQQEKAGIVAVVIFNRALENMAAVNLGGDPDVQLLLAGRGNRIPQELALTVNVRNQP